ncbi:hypothetical protein HZA56_14345 [Candidatus Poribacteria bacterium]|nr:hypothetical protein [Candidatus Poribacteria bacterium]
MKKVFIVWLSLVTLLVSASPAISHEVKAEDAANPIRVAAYVLHPVGYVLYQVVVRPLHGIVSQPGIQELFGHKEDVFEQRIWEEGVCAPIIPSAKGSGLQPLESGGDVPLFKNAPEEPSEAVQPSGEVVPQESPQPESEEGVLPPEQPSQTQMDTQPGTTRFNFQPRRDTISIGGER